MKKYNLLSNRIIKDPFSPVHYIDLYTPYKNILSLIGKDSMTAWFYITVYNYYNDSFHGALGDFLRAFARIKYGLEEKK